MKGWKKILVYGMVWAGVWGGEGRGQEIKEEISTPVLLSKLQRNYKPRVLINARWGSGPEEIGLWEVKLTSELLQKDIEIPPPRGPLTFTVDEKGNIYIMDTVNKAVKKFDLKDSCLKTIISNVSARAIEVDNNENIYLLRGNSIQQYSKNGNLIESFQISNDIELLRGYGQGIFFDKAGNLMVNKIQEFYCIGESLKTEQKTNKGISRLKTLDSSQQMQSRKKVC